MRYIDYLKLYIKLAAWMYSAAIIIYGIICYLGSIQPISISAGTIAQAVSFIIFTSFGHWWFEALKK
jgi:hypothetical protein